MKQIIIKTDFHSAFLRTEAVSIAIEYENIYMKDRKEGFYNCVLRIKEGTNSKYRFAVYHTKKSIIVDIKRLI